MHAIRTPIVIVATVSLISGLQGLAPSTARGDDQTRFPVFTTSAGSKIPCGHCAAPPHLESEAYIALTKEPGERLILSGTIYRADGAPAVGIVLFAYQTDATGYYNKEDDAFNPRLHGWVKTDKDGHYTFRTIRPGAYPHRNTPAHIHVHVYGPNIPERSIEEYRFADDPRLSAKEREEAKAKAHYSPVVTITRRSDGTWEGVRDIKLP
jgi:protocatechuate 3,4-dioxygenase beta subunit